ncbi:hypothetical protein PS467_40515 [Streptomyces luomodiensis]|uniref:Uncharacterized protein n=1 Tax=Streptomyces luomodiensis TaxID=3026192 RepID=A0ABY9VEP4_9ACTN|nr:hypothetical protein [Streptomyces sp. SCA4-21]WNF01186.1 hypothetical protein PS467_40515 [Streptomyces sp. SCA4-21]
MTFPWLWRLANASLRTLLICPPLERPRRAAIRTVITQRSHGLPLHLDLAEWRAELAAWAGAGSARRREVAVHE